MKTFATTPLVPAKPVTEINLCGWIGQAPAGAVLEYHRGFLRASIPMT